MAEPILRIDDVSKTFHSSGQDVRALETVSLTVADREFVALLGPSGCGKSTLLNLMAGLLIPSGGTIHINGRPVVGPPPEVGMMFQRPVLLDWRTARQNVLLPIHACATVAASPAGTASTPTSCSIRSASAGSSIATRQSCPVGCSSVSPSAGC